MSTATQAMHDLTYPRHEHAHRVWLLPDTALGRWSAFVFCVAAAVAVGAPVLAWVTQHLIAASAGTLWFFLLWGSALVASALAVAAALAAACALVRDHAVVLVAPVLLGALAVAVSATALMN